MASKQPARKKANGIAAKPKAPTPPKTLLSPPWLTLTVGFGLLWFFTGWLYGDVFCRAEQESFVSTDAAQMKFLTDRPFGMLFWYGRFLLLTFKSSLVGSLLLAILLTGTACLTNYLLRVPRRWRSVGFIVPIGILAYFLVLGTNLYYKSEPSIIFLLPLGVFLLLGSIAIPVRFFRKPPAASPRAPLFSIGNGLLLVLFGGLYFATYHFNENQLLTARMQLRMQRGDWQGMIDDGLSARRPTRAVAAYYAIGLEQTDQLLERLFDLPFDYPDPRLKKKDGNEEYGIFIPDCSLVSGLLNTAYHYGLERIVMDGPSLYNVKLLVICSLLNGEQRLAEKYLDILESTPWEGTFVNKYRPMVQNPKLIENEPDLQHILSLYSKETERFEQNYRLPTFLGYNMGLLQGSDATIYTSAAACLYSKDLNLLLSRAAIFQQKGFPFPAVMQQAIYLYHTQHEDQQVLDRFKIGQYVPSDFKAFVTDAAPLLKDKKALREQLKERWLGTYFYYYYCENNEQNQADSRQGDGVN